MSALARSESVRVLFSICGVLSVASLIVSWLVVAHLWPAPNAFLLAAWGTIMFFMALASAGLVDRYRSSSAAEKSRGRLWMLRLGIYSIVHGTAWGALSIVTLPPQPPAEHLFVMLVLGTMGLGAAGALTPSRLAFYGFLVPVTLIAATSVVLSGQAPAVLGDWVTVAYLAALVGLHELFHRNLAATHVRRFASEALAHEQQLIFDTASDCIAFIRDERIVKANRQFAALVGGRLDEIIGKPLRTWFADEAAWQQTVAAARKAIFGGGSTYRTVVELHRDSGQAFQCEINGSAVDPAKPQLGSVWMGRDVTAQLRTEAALRNSEQRFRDLLSLSTDWYWEQDEQFRFTQLSGGMARQSGVAAEQVIGKRLWEIEMFRSPDSEQWLSHRATLARHEPFRDFVHPLHAPGAEVRWLSISGTPVFHDDGKFVGYHGVGTDITERVRAAEQYRHLAHHDTLTGLPNRRLLADRLEKALALARRSDARVALMLLDLDDFKQINDAEGHSVGDGVLIGVAQRLNHVVRESDTVARLGGDEFVILLQDAGQPRDVARIAGKIIESVREPVKVGDHQYKLGASIGIAVFPEHGDDAEKLMQRADIAMYEAKRTGGSAYQFSELESGAEGRQIPLIEPSATRH
jgi:diguanylate cyclase (GGDEF)-like protein/PAS domain S-box-containing protein